MNIQIFGKSKCFDTKKAERWFKERRIKFQSIDLVKYGISPGELKSVLNAVGLEALVDPKHPDAALLNYLAYDADKVEKLLDNTQWAEGAPDTDGGSGATRIAAESVGQQAFLMEMEPAFVDTIVRRYIRTTGKTTGIRLIRKGSEQPREVFEGIFE